MDSDSNLAESHALAVLLLLSSRQERETDKAVRFLEALSARVPDNVRFHNDLSAAYLVRAERSDRPSDLVRALEYAELAAHLVPDLPEARFNQALAREYLWLGQASVETWRTYLLLDSDSGWAKDAQGHLTRLESFLAQDSDAAFRWTRHRNQIANEPLSDRTQDLVDLHRTAARHWVERELLPSWAEVQSQGDAPGAERQLRVAEATARALSSLQGDSMLQDSVNAIRQALRLPAPQPRLRLLVRGHLAFGEASRNWREHQPKEAAKDFQEAVDLLRSAGSPFWLKAQIGLAVSLFLLNRPQTALDRLTEVEPQIAAYNTLRARASWIAALCHQQQPRPLHVLREYRRSLQLYLAVGERENAVNVHIRLAEALDGLGEVELAWRHRFLALEGSQYLRDAQQRHYVFGEAAGAALKLGLSRAALLLQNRAVETAHETSQAVNGALAHFHRAAIHSKLGNVGPAAEDLSEASEFAAQVSDVHIARPILAGIAEVQGALLLETDPDAAAEALGRAIELRKEAGGNDFLGFLYAQRAQAYLAANQQKKAKSDLRRSVSRIEMEWQDVLLDPSRRREISWPAYFDKNQEIFSLLIGLLASEGEPQKAFETAEQARAREPLDLALRASLSRDRRKSLARSLGPKSAEQIQNGLPSGTFLVQYRAVQDRLLIWVVSRDRFVLAESPASISEIQKWIQAVYGHLGGWVQERDMHAALEKLHEALIPSQAFPIDSPLKLVFVSDGPVQGVPFAALRDSTSKRFLIEDHVIAASPSASLYLLSLSRNRELSEESADSLLAVANPDFDRSFFPELPDLPGAEKEAVEIRGLYSGPPPLTGSGATKEKFLSLLGKFSVVHFAGHAIPNPQTPSQSLLLLAPFGEDTGALFAFELLSHDFERTRLVVLAACSTSGGYPIGSIGVSGLVRPFLGGGVPAVVASLWDVGDATTPPLLTAFHRHFRAGKDASIALREAQLELLRGTNRALNSVGSWASFQVIGEVSPD